MIETSLENLDTDYIDLMLIHSPRPWQEFFTPVGNNYFAENIDVWHAMEETYKNGKLRSIGVSNFDIMDIDNIISNCEIAPMVNQIRVHIGHTPKDIIDYCQNRNILVEAYSPNATGKLTGNKIISEMAQKYNVSVPQLGIRYCLQLNLLPLPKSVNIEHIKQNAQLDFVITSEDMKKLSEIEEINSL